MGSNKFEPTTKLIQKHIFTTSPTEETLSFSHSQLWKLKQRKYLPDREKRKTKSHQRASKTKNSIQKSLQKIVSGTSRGGSQKESRDFYLFFFRGDQTWKNICYGSGDQCGGGGAWHNITFSRNPDLEGGKGEECAMGRRWDRWKKEGRKISQNSDFKRSRKTRGFDVLSRCSSGSSSGASSYWSTPTCSNLTFDGVMQ